MNRFFEKYYHHHKILNYLREQKLIDIKNKSKTRSFTLSELSKVIGKTEKETDLILYTIIENGLISQTNSGKSFNFSRDGFYYSRFNYFKRKSKEHFNSVIVPRLVNYLLIIVSFIAILKSFDFRKNQLQLIEQEQKLLKDKVKSIEILQTKLKANQQWILKDSVFLK